jgi:hypothetical protein
MAHIYSALVFIVIRKAAPLIRILYVLHVSTYGAQFPHLPLDIWSSTKNRCDWNLTLERTVLQFVLIQLIKDVLAFMVRRTVSNNSLLYSILSRLIPVTFCTHIFLEQFYIIVTRFFPNNVIWWLGNTVSVKLSPSADLQPGKLSWCSCLLQSRAQQKSSRTVI